jgi:hypothetical protein
MPGPSRKNQGGDLESCERHVCSPFPQLLQSSVLTSPNRFLLAELHMQTLMSQFTRGDIEEALENLPRGEKGLDETYSQAMKRIEDQKASEKLARRFCRG